MGPHFDLEPHMQVSQTRDAGCTRVINDKSVVVSVFQKKRLYTGRVSTRREQEELYTKLVVKR